MTSPLSKRHEYPLRIASQVFQPVSADVDGVLGRSISILTASPARLGSRKEHFFEGHRIRRAWYYSGLKHLPEWCLFSAIFAKTKHRSVVESEDSPDATWTILSEVNERGRNAFGVKRRSLKSPPLTAAEFLLKRALMLWQHVSHRIRFNDKMPNP